MSTIESRALAEISSVKSLLIGLERDRRKARPSWRTPKKPIDLLFRSAAQRLRDHVLNGGGDTLTRQYGDDEQFALLEVIHNKAAVTPATTTGVTGNASNPWAAELVGIVVAQWSQALKPSVYAQLIDAGTLALDYAEGGALRVPGRDATPRVNGSFIGEGQPIPTRRLGLNSTPLLAKKVGVIVPFTRELARSSPYNVEAVMRAEITADTAVAVDGVLLDATAADAIRPAGLRFGVTGLTPAAAGITAASTDLKALIAAVQPASRVGIILNATQLPGLALALPVTNAAIVVMPSSSVTAGIVIAVDLDAFVSASSLPQFSVSEEAVVHEEDTNPLPISATGTPNTVAAPVRSFFQTAVIGVKLEWPLNWALRRTGGVAWMSGVTW